MNALACRSRISHLVLGVIFMSVTAGAQATESDFQKLGVYVVVSDVGRSVEFYTRIFQKQPYVRTDSFAAFDVAGGLYAVFAERASDIRRSRGNSTVPYLRVTDAHRALERVAALDVRLLDKQVVQEGPITLFRFLDPDDNVVEMFSVATTK
jgi:catechol 2,3-dioxygenase-like lactoylglutathione lyase family enzyme